MKRRMVGGAIAGLALVGAMVFATANPAQAIGNSSNVAILTEGPQHLPRTGFPGGGPTFTDRTAAQIATPGNPLAGFDTLVLEHVCDISALLNGSAGTDFKTNVDNFVQAGNKLIIWDGGCLNNDYGQFLFPFRTASFGPAGAAGGGLAYAEANSLGNDSNLNPAQTNLVPIVEGTNAALRSNQFYTTDANWCVSVKADVSGGTQGGVINYAKSGEGLVVYSGLRADAMPGGSFNLNTNGADQLNRLYNNQLTTANFSTLKCSVKAQASITITPASQTQVAGGTVPLAVHVTSDGVPVVGKTVTLKVTSGPDINIAPATGVTDSSGDVPGFTYTSSIPGSDTVTATVQVLDDPVIVPPIAALTTDATVTWTSRVATTAPVVNATPVFTG